MDDLASVWCGWAEMELAHDEFDLGLQTIQRAVAEPAAAVQRRRLQASQSRDEKRRAVSEVGEEKGGGVSAQVRAQFRRKEELLKRLTTVRCAVEQHKCTSLTSNWGASRSIRTPGWLHSR